MANYSAIKAAVNAYIKQNGRKEITGRILNAVLNATIDSLGRFFQFAGGAMPTDDPGTPDQNVCYLAGEPGVYTNFGGITIENEEVALLFWNGEWTKQRILIGIREVNASVDNQVGTPSVDVSYSEGRLVLTFHNLKGDKGDTGDPAGFGTIGADITGGVGTPGVSVESSGDNASKNLMFHFTNLKGETGVTSVIATIDNTSGTPSCQVSLVNGVLTLAFSGLKGLKGDTGVSADYPITIYNGLDSDATDQALAAYQGKVLDGKIDQLEAKVTDKFSEETELLTADATEYALVIESDVWAATSTTPGCRCFPVSAGQIVKITANSSRATKWAFLASLPTSVQVGDSPDYADSVGIRTINAGLTDSAVVPSDCYLYVRYRTSTMNANYFPSKIVLQTPWEKINEWDGLKNKVDGNEFALFNEGKLSAKFVKNEYIGSNNGEATPYQGWTRTDYINVRLFTKVKVSAIHASQYGAVYDANKQRLARFNLVNGDAILEVAGDIHYLRVSDQEQYMSRVSFEILGYKTDESNESSELVDEVFGKVTELSPAKYQDGYINEDGTTGTATNYVISVPVKLKRGQKITINSYIPRDCAGLALTDAESSFYTPVIVNKSTGAVMTKEYVAPQDCYVAWSYITSKTHEMSVSAAVDIYSIYEGVEPQDKTGILDFNPSVEFTPKFIAGKKKTNNVEPLVLLAFSDIHSKALENLPRILQFHTEHASRIDEILNLGDMVSNQFSNDFVFGQVEGAENVLTIIGNHDTANYSGGVYDWTAHAGLDAYNKYIAPFVSNWGVTQPENAATNGYCYYYKDYTTQGIRIVFLDVMGYDATEESWLESVLADAKTNNLSVLIAAHYAGAKVTGYDGKYSPVINNYVNRTSYNSAFYGSVNVVETFITGGGKFIGWIVGHFHEDLIGKLDGTNQVCLVVDTAQFGQYSDSAEYDKIEGTPTQDAFSVICIDTEAKTLSTFKVGCRRDKWQRTRDSVCVNYETANILCEN